MGVDKIDPRDIEALEGAARARRERDAALTPGQRIEQAAALILQAEQFKIRDRGPSRHR